MGLLKFTTKKLGERCRCKLTSQPSSNIW